MHVSVLAKEVIEYLAVKENENFVDATLGNGGHTLKILEHSFPQGKVLGIDQDFKQIENAKNRLLENYGDRLIFVCDNFNNLKNIVEKNNFRNIAGIVLDLGFASWHLEGSGRGFSFLKNEPLDMRMNLQETLTAYEIVNYWSYQEIERILKTYGEERFFRPIAQEIIKQRKVKPLTNTLELVNLVKKTVPTYYRNSRIHCATKTFQALRIAVNQELDNLTEVLPQILDVLNDKGRIVVISFHSLEDKIVKSFLQEAVKNNKLKLINKKPVIPSQEEIKINPRSRSAKLRAAIKI